MSSLVPFILDSLSHNKTVEMKVSGNSMYPFLLDRLSSVILSKPLNLKKGDIVLYKRNDDHYVLHRIISINDDKLTYDIVGDNQYHVDKHVLKEVIIAKVIAYNRKGKGFKKNDSLYRLIFPVIRRVRYFGKRIVHYLKRFGGR